MGPPEFHVHGATYAFCANVVDSMEEGTQCTFPLLMCVLHFPIRLAFKTKSKHKIKNFKVVLIEHETNRGAFPRA